MLLRVALVFIALANSTNGSSAQAVKIVDGGTLKIGDVTYLLLNRRIRLSHLKPTKHAFVSFVAIHARRMTRGLWQYA